VTLPLLQLAREYPYAVGVTLMLGSIFVGFFGKRWFSKVLWLCSFLTAFAAGLLFTTMMGFLDD
jgi:hypothetical protein